MHPSRTYMEEAINVARQARLDGDYAVGSVIVKGNKIISMGGNRTHIDNDATMHAELIAIKAASNTLDSKDLSGCALYSTHEPCPMCMSAIIWARISKVVFGASMEEHKAFRDQYSTEQWKWRVIDVPAEFIASRGDPSIELYPGYMRKECCELFHV